jgi:hypothetical protein
MKKPVILAVSLAVLLLLVFFACAGLFISTASYLILGGLSETTVQPTSVETVITLEPPILPATEATALPRPVKPGLAEPHPTSQSLVDQSSASADRLAAEKMLEMLSSTEVPINDPIDLASRLLGLNNIQRTLTPPLVPLGAGSQQAFWVMNTDDNTNFQVTASLRYITDHLYFWIEDGVRYNERDLKRLAETFESMIYPTNRAFFGSEWSPGVDGDQRLHILYAGGLGSSIAGYFSSADEYPSLINEYSNQRELFLLNADNVDLDEPFTYGVLAHEFQHMIHWFQDRNEESWMNEGFSELAAFINDYDTGGSDLAYALDADLQLTDWPSPPESSHYGAAFLFLNYFLDRFGEQITQTLVADSANGLASIDKVLLEQGVLDPVTGKQIQADDVFGDWVIASYLQNPRIGDGRYTYHSNPSAARPNVAETIRDCPSGSLPRQVRQYGVDYIRIRCRGDYTLQFQANELVNLLPTNPYSGDSAFWSNRGDESDMTLTRSFDLRGMSGPLTLNYWTWFDIEEGFDYLYLLASQDGGQTWQILTTPSGTAMDPSGNSFGWGYTGTSRAGAAGSQWVEESVDLSQFAGQELQLRFEYVTDAAVNGDGLLIDDISIPEIGYFTDFEGDAGGWKANGFVMTQNLLPQTFRLAVIQDGKNPTVQQYTLNGNNNLEIPLQIGGDIKEVVLLVSGTTRVTRQPAEYKIEIR